jgi:GT2 family glycosyltransferase
MNSYQIVGSIVTYKTCIVQLNKAIKSFLSTKLLVKLVIIDNSPDSRIEKLLPENPKIQYIFNNANLGYGAAHNVGFKKFINNTEYYLVLNPDVYFSDGVLEELYNFMNLNKQVGLVMPKVKYPNGEIQYLCKLLPTPTDWFLRRFLPEWSYTAKRNKLFEFRFTDYNKIIEVPYLSGCFMFLRSETLIKVGFFDEKIFLHTEDADLSRRIYNSYKNIYLPTVVIYHEFQKESHKNLKMMIIHIKSTIYYFNKWGWIFDKDRRTVNKRVIAEFQNK